MSYAGPSPISESQPSWLAAGARTGLVRAAVFVGFFAYAGLLVLAWWTLSHLIPDHLSFRLLGHRFELHQVHEHVLSNAMVMLLILPSTLWLECALVGWERSSCRQFFAAPTASIKTDLAFFLLDQAHVMGALGRIMMLGVSLISGLWVRNWLAAHTGLSIHPLAIAMPLQVAFYFYVFTFFDYWTHRVAHAPIFWPLHRFHHAATEFCVVTAGRSHPAGFIEVFMMNIPMAILGAPAEVMIYVNVMTLTLGFIIHSRIESDFGWIGRYVIQSPLHHRAHHKLDMTRPTGHFAMAPLWDRLFGTWSDETDAKMAIGVDTEYRHGLWIGPDLLRDYVDFWKGLAGQRQKSPSEM